MSHPQSHPFPHYRPCPIPIIAIHAPVNMYPPIEAKRAEKAKAYATQYKYLYGQLKRSENPKGFLPAAGRGVDRNLRVRLIRSHGTRT